jgi:hypothetical protein
MGLLDELLSLFLPPPKQYGTLSVTIRGEQVKSHAEQKIADFLSRNGIRYEYERPIEVGIWIFNEELCRPDFYLPDYDVYIEYWGMMDVDDCRKRLEYRRSMAWKMKQYRRYNIKYISIYPDNLKKLDWVLRKRFKEATGQDLPRLSASPPKVRPPDIPQERQQAIPPVITSVPPQERRTPASPAKESIRTGDITFECGSCGQSLVVEEAGAGHTLDCPTCGKPVCVPTIPVPASKVGVHQN